METFETRSGATYLVDPERLRILRNGPGADTDGDKPDGEWLAIAAYGTVEVEPGEGPSLWFQFPDGRTRITTPIVGAAQ